MCRRFDTQTMLIRIFAIAFAAAPLITVEAEEVGLLNEKLIITL